MAILSDWHVRALSKQQDLLKPFSDKVDGDRVISYGLTHAGYDFRLGHTVFICKGSFCEIVSPKRMKAEQSYLHRIYDEHHALEVGDPILIPAHGYVLGFTLEHISMPRWLKARCVGKSSLARCGIIINTTPIEPGWRGHLTLEIGNLSPNPVEVYAGEGIAQVEFETLLQPTEEDYGDKIGKYQDQEAAPTPARVKP